MSADMDLSNLQRKTLKVPRGYTYTYYTSPANSSNPTLLLCHGWPDTAALFAGFINDSLVPAGYGVIAPDFLGYGGTSKPTDPKEYTWDKMTADIVAILDAESISTIVSVGHDWGCLTAQRMYSFHPSRVIGLVLINVAYLAPTGQPFSLEAVNKQTEEYFGHGIYEYWHFTTAEDGSKIESDNLESVYTVAFGEPTTWLDNWCTPGGMRKYLTEGRTQPTLPFATGAHREDFMTRLKESGFEAPNCWYKAMAFNYQSEVEKTVVDNAVCKVPVFFWGGEGDVVCRPAALQGSIDAGLLPNVKSKTRPGGHWALLERPKVFGEDVMGWLQATYA